jgi:predicted DNA-binding protein with PD1-like motif
MRAKLLDRIDGRRTWLLVFDTDDEVVSACAEFAARERLEGALVTGAGAMMQVALGCYDYSRGDYRRTHVDGQVEVCSLTGNVALYDGRPRLHAHVVVSSFDGMTRGGQLLEGFVRPNLELTVVETPPLRRRRDAETGLPLLDLRE